MSVILSIKPKYVKSIVEGYKRVEFRKQIFKRPIDYVFIYSSAPVKSIVGFFTVKEIVCNTPSKLWKDFNITSGITKKEFFAYYEGTQHGYSISIDSLSIFNKKIKPKNIIPEFIAPQSYIYIDDTIEKNFLRRPFTTHK